MPCRTSSIKEERVEGKLLSPYAVSKRTDGEWAKQYTKHYGLDTYGLRYFNVFGRRQSRDFTYIENVIEANLKACQAFHDVAVEVFNIAFGGREYLFDIYYNLVDVLGIKEVIEWYKESIVSVNRI